MNEDYKLNSVYYQLANSLAEFRYMLTNVSDFVPLFPPIIHRQLKDISDDMQAAVDAMYENIKPLILEEAKSKGYKSEKEIREERENEQQER